MQLIQQTFLNRLPWLNLIFLRLVFRVVFQYFYWPFASKITAFLPVSANFLAFLIPSLQYRGEILSHNTTLSVRLLPINSKCLYWQPKPTGTQILQSPFQDILCIFCLLSRTVFEILHFYAQAGCLLLQVDLGCRICPWSFHCSRLLMLCF